ncbi:MAG: hypothetical protein NT033_05475, partial [Candidatus Omnitrophica bacterium]|nr:hypothetical protein [Candidatus Omnitrophota bacterium]
MSYNPQGSSASPTCYDGISGSVIPCNDQIDWVDTGVSILGIPHSHFFAPFKKLEKLGYTFNPIEQKKYSYEGIDFLKAVVKSKGQIFLQLFHKFKNDHFGNPADGFHSPFGCIPGKAIEDGSFLNKLNQLGDTYFNKTLKKNDIFFERCAFKCGPFNFGWGIRLSDTTIGPKAIQAGYMCYGGTSKLRAKAYYINIDDHMAGPAGAPDMRLFSKYLLGLGPDSRYYETYPPQLDRCHNVDVANIGDYGGPCLAQGNAIPC